MRLVQTALSQIEQELLALPIGGSLKQNNRMCSFCSLMMMQLRLAVQR